VTRSSWTAVDERKGQTDRVGRWQQACHASSAALLIGYSPPKEVPEAHNNAERATPRPVASAGETPAARPMVTVWTVREVGN
jgi:hypothetical protein